MNASQRVRVAVGEHPRALRGDADRDDLEPPRVEVVAIGITPQGSWVLTDGYPAALAISDRQLPEVTSASGTELALPAETHEMACSLLRPPKTTATRTRWLAFTI
ncbi:hypothetical protein MAHJHV54_49500 [Mycobacterium avium subsp. hominissuis]